MLNNPNYETYQNFENYLLILQRQDWKKNVSVKTSINYSSQNINSILSPDFMKHQKTPVKADTSSGVSNIPMEFNDHRNMKLFMESKMKDIQEKQKSRLDELKEEINTIINKLYGEITNTAFSLDKYSLPLHGIVSPSLENPMNLFQRQLKIEELSFDLSQTKYKAQLDSLIKIGKGD